VLARSTRPPSAAVADNQIVELADDEALRLGLPAGSRLRVDRARRPSNGDLVWVELIRFGSTERLVRRYARDAGWVTLTVPDGSVPAIMRRRGELLLLGVVVGQEAAPNPDPA